MFDIDSTTRPLSNLLTIIGERQQVTGHNIANVHTPGYVGQDLSFKDVLARNGAPFETRLSKKLSSQGGPGSENIVSTGQPVNLHTEFLKMNENLLYYNMVTRRLGTVLTGMKTAAQIGR